MAASGNHSHSADKGSKHAKKIKEDRKNIKVSQNSLTTMDESDSDADLANYAPSGFSQNSHTSEPALKVTKELTSPIKEVETLSTPSDDHLRRGESSVICSCDRI